MNPSCWASEAGVSLNLTIPQEDIGNRKMVDAEGHEKCAPHRPTHRGSSCNNATMMRPDLTAEVAIVELSSTLPRW